MNTDVQKLDFCVLPTPIHRLNRLSEHLGAEIWIKRDDLTGFALGGNKGRKLEYLMAEAKAAGATVVVGSGASESNFVRQLAAACGVLGIRCVAVTMAAPYQTPERAKGKGWLGGNQLLDPWVPIERRVFPDGTWDDLEKHADSIAEELTDQGETVYQVPLGGSTPLAVHAFVEAGKELLQQSEPFDWIVAASSSGGTQVGLTHAMRGVATRVLGISADPEPEIFDDLLDLSKRYAKKFGESPLGRDDIHFDLDYVGEGYGIPHGDAIEAIDLMLQTEGIFLDPIYSGKAFCGLLGNIRTGRIGGRILFWHTGGIPTLFGAWNSGEFTLGEIPIPG